MIRNLIYIATLGFISAFLLHHFQNEIQTVLTNLVSIDLTQYNLVHIYILLGLVSLSYLVYVIPFIVQYGVAYKEYLRKKHFLSHEVTLIYFFFLIILISYFVLDADNLSLTKRYYDDSQYLLVIGFFAPIISQLTLSQFKKITEFSKVIHVFFDFLLLVFTVLAFLTVLEKAYTFNLFNIVALLVLTLSVFITFPFNLVSFIRSCRAGFAVSKEFGDMLLKGWESSGFWTTIRLFLHSVRDGENRYAEAMNFEEYLGEILKEEGERHSQKTNEQKIVKWFKDKFEKILGKAFSVVDTDTPDNKPDMLQRQPFVNGLYDLIDKHFNSLTDKAITIGLYGQWGSGKSFIIQRLKSRLENQRSDITVSVIEPYKLLVNGDTKSLISGVCSDLENSLSGSIRGIKLKNLISKLSIQLSHSIESTTTLFPRFSLSSLFFRVDNDIEDTIKAISANLKQHNEKLVIILEDLDRLDRQELIQCIRLMRVMSSIRNTVFMLACDYEKVCSLLNGADIRDHAYLQKFVQIERVLPPANLDQIKNYIIGELTEYWGENSKLKKSKIAQDLHSTLKQSECMELIGTMRVAVKIVNNLKVPYASHIHELSIEDLVELEIIRQKTPNIYHSIMTDRELYVPTSVKRKWEYSSDLFKDEDSPKARAIAELNTNIDKLISDNNLSFLNTNNVQTLLKRLFQFAFQNNEYYTTKNRQFRLQDEHSFPLYFQEHLSSEKLSMYTIASFIEKYNKPVINDEVLMLEIRNYLSKNQLYFLCSIISSRHNQDNEIDQEQCYKNIEYLLFHLFKILSSIDSERPLSVGLKADMSVIYRRLKYSSLQPEAMSICVQTASFETAVFVIAFISSANDLNRLKNKAIAYLKPRFLKDYIVVDKDIFAMDKDIHKFWWSLLNDDDDYVFDIYEYYLNLIKNNIEYAKIFLSFYQTNANYDGLNYELISKSSEGIKYIYENQNLSSEVKEILTPIVKGIETIPER